MSDYHKIKIYPPIDGDVQPTAPPDETQVYRLKMVGEVEKFLNGEIIERDRLYKRFNRYSTVAIYAEHALLAGCIICTGAGITALTTGIAAPVAIVLGALGLGATMSQGIIRRTCQIYAKKAKKHNEIYHAAQTILDGISVIVSKAYRDGDISADEYQSIVREKQRYLNLKQKIRQKTKHIVHDINEEQRQAILNQGRKEGKDDFLKQLVGSSATPRVNVI